MNQKFSTKSMRKAIINAINEMDEEKAYITTAGVYSLFKIMEKYYEDKYGSGKRMSDLFEYVTILQSAYLRRK